MVRKITLFVHGLTAQDCKKIDSFQKEYLRERKVKRLAYLTGGMNGGNRVLGCQTEVQELIGQIRSATNIPRRSEGKNSEYAD